MTKSINMVWGPHIARVKTKNILNLKIGLFKTPLSYVELIVLRTDYLRGPHFVRRPPPRLGGSGGASFGTDINPHKCVLLKFSSGVDCSLLNFYAHARS